MLEDLFFVQVSIESVRNSIDSGCFLKPENASAALLIGTCLSNPRHLKDRSHFVRGSLLEEYSMDCFEAIRRVWKLAGDVHGGQVQIIPAPHSASLVASLYCLFS